MQYLNEIHYFNYRNHSVNYQMTVTILFCVLVQIVLLLIILAFKLKHCILEKRHRYRNAVTRVSPTSLTDNKQYENRNSFEMANQNKTAQKSNSRNTEEHRKRTEPASPSLENGLNIIVYNKILVENYMIAFCTLTFIISFLALSFKTNLDIDEIQNCSRIYLYFLDLSPRTLNSIILPVTIHLRNPEIRKYIRGLF